MRRALRESAKGLPWVYHGIMLGKQRNAAVSVILVIVVVTVIIVNVVVVILRHRRHRGCGHGRGRRRHAWGMPQWLWVCRGPGCPSHEYINCCDYDKEAAS